MRRRFVVPEGFEAAAEDAAAQGEDGVGAVDGPVHAGALEARPDGMFAASLDDAGGDAQAPGPERGIAHALTVADEIVDAFAASSQVGAWWARAATMALMRPASSSSRRCFAHCAARSDPGV